MTDQELFAYTQERAKALNEATRANKYKPSDAEDAADCLLRDAIQHFAKDVYNKALLTRDKYGFHPMGWVYPDWEKEMQRQMAEHVLKGDPRDTSWLSTIAWFHGWSTAAPSIVVESGTTSATEKAAFEEWAISKGFDVRKIAFLFLNDNTQNAYLGWKACAARLTTAPAPAISLTDGGAEDLKFKVKAWETAIWVLQGERDRAIASLQELDGVIDFTEALGKGDASVDDTELDWLVREAHRLAAPTSNGN